MNNGLMCAICVQNARHCNITSPVGVIEKNIIARAMSLICTRFRLASASAVENEKGKRSWSPEPRRSCAMCVMLRSECFCHSWPTSVPADHHLESSLQTHTQANTLRPQQCERTQESRVSLPQAEAEQCYPEPFWMALCCSN